MGTPRALLCLVLVAARSAVALDPTVRRWASGPVATDSSLSVMPDVELSGPALLCLSARVGTNAEVVLASTSPAVAEWIRLVGPRSSNNSGALVQMTSFDMIHAADTYRLGLALHSRGGMALADQIELVYIPLLGDADFGEATNPQTVGSVRSVIGQVATSGGQLEPALLLGTLVVQPAPDAGIEAWLSGGGLSFPVGHPGPPSGFFADSTSLRTGFIAGIADVAPNFDVTLEASAGGEGGSIELWRVISVPLRLFPGDEPLHAEKPDSISFSVSTIADGFVFPVDLVPGQTYVSVQLHWQHLKAGALTTRFFRDERVIDLVTTARPGPAQFAVTGIDVFTAPDGGFALSSTFEVTGLVEVWDQRTLVVGPFSGGAIIEADGGISPVTDGGKQLDGGTKPQDAGSTVGGPDLLEFRTCGCDASGGWPLLAVLAFAVAARMRAPRKTE